MNEQDKRITIVIPTYNRRDELARCLTSCKKWMPDSKIIVVDDGGSDGTGEMLQRVFPDVACLRCSVNRGPAHARNRAIEMADTPYLAFFDSDVVFVSDWCKAVAGHLSPDTVLAGRVVRPDGTLEWGPRKTMPWGGSRQCSQESANVASSNNMLVPNEMARSLGGFSERLGIYFEDTYFCIRARRACFKVRYVDEAAIVHIHNSYLNPERKHRFIRNRCYAMVTIAESPWFMMCLQGTVTLGEIVTAIADRRWDIAKACFSGLMAGIKDVCLGRT